MRKIFALAWVSWVFAAAPTLCLGGYIPCPWSRPDHRAESPHSDSCCPDSSPSDSSCPDSSPSDSGLPQGDPCKAQAVKERVAEHNSVLSHLATSLMCLIILDDTVAMGSSQSFRVADFPAFDSTADSFASRGLPLLL